MIQEKGRLSAFPSVREGSYGLEYEPGMNFDDWRRTKYECAALQGLLAANEGLSLSSLAKDAQAIANEMMG